MVLPVFTLYAAHLRGATPVLIGIAMGIYGLTQGLFQIPFGMLSDKIGRKKIIFAGLCIFALGSAVSALTHTITGMMIGRALQGTGAVGSTIIALMADLTREEHRTRAMAMIGMTIGASFSFAFILGPLLVGILQVSGIFWLAGLFSLIAILILLFAVPTPTETSWHADAEPELNQFSAVIKHPELKRLNAGIFILHAVFTASFVIIPINLQNTIGMAGHQQWSLYLPILLLTFLLTIPLIIVAEKKRRLKTIFLGAIFTLCLSEFLFWISGAHLWIFAINLLLFFTAFSVLEAFLPSLVSKTAPRTRKGTALGIYSCSQFLGIFVGGSVGGWLYGAFGLTDVYLFCVTLTLLWAILAFNMKNPQQRTQEDNL